MSKSQPAQENLRFKIEGSKEPMGIPGIISIPLQVSINSIWQRGFHSEKSDENTRNSKTIETQMNCLLPLGQKHGWLESS